MPAQEMNPFSALTRIRYQFLRTQWSTSNHQRVDTTTPQTAQPSGLALATQGPPNSQKCTFLYILAHIWKIGSYFFPLLCICLLCDEILLPWNFRSPGFDIRAPQDPPKYEKKVYIFSYFGFRLKNFLSDCFFIWHVHGYGWEDSWKAR